ncbi:VWA domain-containing protein [Aliidiomarina quisquiliarum]|uniref:VWA domain-containing protein n=1 Tax=Aliidiomarina quisquiliarum TaxID=2938947 RepID=UPI00208F735A|nr:VWA domain-containing protein [Aliidiomarina quisquiliarum]MCO4322003.1 VWA domain-containing protein [Aliidiomarina quisquiliarum]
MQYLTLGNPMFEFGFVWVLMLLPLPLLLLLSNRKQQARLTIRFPGVAARLPTAALSHQSSWRSFVHRYLVPMLIWLCVVLAAAQPRWVGEPIAQQKEAREILIALDLSGSMRQEDMVMNGQRVTRLYAAHHILGDFIRRRQGDRIGLIIYADTAHLYVPMTADLDTVARLAEEAEIGLVGQSTALGDAIGLSIKYFLDRSSNQRVILMLTDGMVNSGNLSAEQALLLAKNNDVRIHTIGIGSDEMIVPGLFGDRRVNPSQELNEDFLTEVAAVTGGEYFRARNVNEMERVYQIIDELEPLASGEHYFRPQKSLVYWPLAAAMLLVLLQAFSRWLSLLNGARRKI